MRYLWRISCHCDLARLGGERADGRWHTAARGKRIVYLSEHPALALVEVPVNLKGDPRLFPETYQLMKVEMPDEVGNEEGAVSTLAGSWRDDAGATRARGDAWLRQQRSALLAVPSAPSPESLNYLLSARHPDAKRLVLLWCKEVRYDRRLFSIR